MLIWVAALNRSFTVFTWMHVHWTTFERKSSLRYHLVAWNGKTKQEPWWHLSHNGSWYKLKRSFFQISFYIMKHIGEIRTRFFFWVKEVKAFKNYSRRQMENTFLEVESTDGNISSQEFFKNFIHVLKDCKTVEPETESIYFFSLYKEDNIFFVTDWYTKVIFDNHFFTLNIINE